MILWFLIGVGGALILWDRWHPYPRIDLGADALTLLNFRPYTLVNGRDTYRYFLAREGMTRAQVASGLGEPGIDVKLTRSHIPLPMAGTFADLWAVHTEFYPGHSGVEMSPQSILRQANPGASIENAPLQLANLLSMGQSLLVPIAAKQNQWRSHPRR